MKGQHIGGRRRAALCAGGSVLVAFCFAGGSARAERIKLQDGAEFSGSVVGRDGESVTVNVPRLSVASVDGQPLPPPVVAGKAAPAFSVVDLDGATHTLGSAEGEATLINFWASWCPHCRHDVTLMKDLFARYHGKGVRFVMVSVDQDVNALNTFIRDQHLPYPVIAANGKPNSPASELPELYEARGIPVYYVVDAKGVIAKVISGSVAEKREDLEGLLKSLLPATPSPVASAR